MNSLQRFDRKQIKYIFNPKMTGYVQKRLNTHELLKKEMKLTGILSAYEEAREKDILTYLSNPTKGSLHKCLIDFINSNHYNPSYDNIILGYFPGLKTIGNVIFNSNEDDFKSMASLLKGTTANYSRSGLLPLLKILLDYDIQFSIDTINAIKEVQVGELTVAEFEKQLIKTYTEKSLFTEIHINGDVNNQVGPLSMDDYYIQLSYIDHQDLNNRESLIYLEKQYSHSKIKDTKMTYLESDLSQGYISENILFNDKIIITGNPGVGKSTYARWLCYGWAQEYHLNSGWKTPIYIQLRDLNMDSQNFLEDYINNYYFSNSDKKITTLGVSEHIHLLLDGFDELGFEERLKLTQRVQSLNYILLSRPYGLIQHNLNYDFSIQIDGFNSNCIDIYIKNVLKDEDLKSELLALIKKSRVLNDYASTPLMLSYMVLIFSISDDAQKTLSSIESAYDLQEKVFDWILDYEEKKGALKKDILENMKHRINQFAYLMLINKQFSYSGNLRDSFFEIAEFLSDIGLGSQKKTDLDSFQWKFTFNTVTFQEFLAAQYFENKKFNHEALVYLVTDSFFWNFCIMIVGMLSKEHSLDLYKHEKESTLRKILDFLYRFYSKNNTKFYGYAYYMLLAECRKSMVQNIIKSNDIEAMITFYEEVYFDSFWNKAIYESIDKIIFKLSENKQDEYVTILINEIAKNPNGIESKVFYHLRDLIKTGIVYDENNICNAVIKLFKNAKNEKSISQGIIHQLFSGKDIEEALYDEETVIKYEYEVRRQVPINQLIIELSYTLQLMSSKSLLPHKNFINDLFYTNEFTRSFLTYIVPKVSPNHNIADLIRIYEEIKKEYNVLIQDPEKFFQRILELAEYLFILFHKREISSNKDQKIIFEIVSLLNNYVLNIKFFDEETNHEQTFLIDAVIQLLIYSDNERLYSDLFKLVTYYNANIFSHIPDQEALEKYIQNKFKQLSNNLKTQKVMELVCILEKTPNVDLDFFLFREKLIHLFKDIYRKLKSLPDNKEFTKERSDLEDLLSRIASVPKKSYDKKIFIDKLFIDEDFFEDNKKIGLEIIWKLTDELLFYEDKYWTLFLNFFEWQEWHSSTTIRFLNIEGLFLFTSNYPKILSVFVNTFSKEKNLLKEQLHEEIHETIPLISDILFHLKDYHGEYRKITLQLIETILRNPDVEKFCKESCAEMIDTKTNFLAIVLFYYFSTSKSAFLKTTEFYRTLVLAPSIKADMLDAVIEFSFSENYGVEMNEIEIFEPILGTKLYADLLTLIDQRLVNKNQFDPNHLEMLLGQVSE